MLKKLDVEEIFENKYLKLNKITLKYTCLWPDQNPRLQKYGYIHVFLMISMLIPQFIRSIEEIQADYWNLHILFENLTGFLYLTAVSFKYVTFVRRAKQLGYLFEEVSKDWIEITEPKERVALSKSALISYYFTVGAIVYTAAGAFLFVSFPSFLPTFLNYVIPKNETRPISLCYYAEYFIDQQEYFFYLYIHTLFAVYSSAIVSVAVNSVFYLLLYHVMGLLNVMRYCHLIQACFSDILFLVTVFDMLSFATSGVLVVSSTADTAHAARLVLATGTGFLYIVYINWPTQALLNKYFDILQAIYSCGWYNFPLKTQHTVLFMMMRANNVFEMTAGPFIRMNFEVLGSIIKTGVTYTTIMLSLT